MLEDKRQLKERTGVSPDETNAFVETFAEPVTPRARNAVPLGRAATDYSPLASMNTLVQDSYDPYRGK